MRRMNGSGKRWQIDCDLRGQTGQFRRPGQNEEVDVLLARLTDNVQLPVGSIPAPRFYMTL